MAYQSYTPYQPYNPYQQGSYAQPQQTMQPQSSFSCRPVTSREEALAMQTDFLAAGTIMPDLGHGIIYLKRFNPNTGASDFLEFAYRQPHDGATQFVTVEEFNSFKADILGRLEGST